MKKLIHLLVLVLITAYAFTDGFNPKPHNTTSLPESGTAVVVGHSVRNLNITGPRLTANVGRALTGHGEGREGIVILAVDDADVHGDTGTFSKTYGEYAIRIAPGKHELLCKTNVGSKMHHAFTITAEKGRTYIINWKEGSWPFGDPSFWIEDKDTGEIITKG